VATTIPQKELRNNIGAVLRRVEAGQTLTVTVAGRPVAELRPASRQTWVSGPTLQAIWAGDAPRDMAEDIATFGAGLADPYQ